MNPKWTQIVLPAGSVQYLAALPDCPNLAVALAVEGQLRWYSVDVSQPSEPAVPLALEADSATLALIAGDALLLSSEGDAYEWPAGKRLGRFPRMGYSTAAAPWLPLASSSAGNLFTVPRTGELSVRIARWHKDDGALDESEVREVRLGTMSSPTAVVSSPSNEFLLVVTAGDRSCFIDGAGTLSELKHNPDGHPFAGALHPSRPVAAVMSRRAEIFDLSSGMRTDVLHLRGQSKLAGVFTDDALWLVSQTTLWRYDLATRACVEVCALPGHANGLELPSFALMGEMVVLGRAEGVFTARLPELLGTGANTAAGRLSNCLEGAAHGEAHVNARFGAASVVLEAVRGLASPTTHDAGTPRCPACESTATLKKLSPIKFEALTKGRPHTLLPVALDWAGAEYDETAFLALQFTEMFRGARGTEHLRRWLLALELLAPGEGILEWYAWPKVHVPGAPSTDLARPSLLVLTPERLLAFVFLPLRAHGASILPAARIDACWSAARAAASALGTNCALRVIAADGHPALKQDDEGTLPWSTALAALTSVGADIPRLSRVTQRWAAALNGQTFPRPAGSWTSAIEQRSAKYDFETPVFPFRNQSTLSKDGSRVCHGCGFVLGGHQGWSARVGENASWLDIVSELADDPALASAWLRELGLPAGSIEATLFWPRLSPSGTTPDTVFVGSDALVVVEAKRVDARLNANDQTAREVLVRVAAAILLARREPGRIPRVLVVGATVDPEGVARRLAEQAWTFFIGDERSVRSWSKKSGPVVFGASHDASIAIGDAGVSGLRDIILVRTFERLSETLSQVAREFSDRCRHVDPQAAMAYRGMSLRAQGFGTLRAQAK